MLGGLISSLVLHCFPTIFRNKLFEYNQSKAKLWQVWYSHAGGFSWQIS